MSLLFSAPTETVSTKAPIIVIYGVSGVGKTEFASTAPDVLFLFTENGQRDHKVKQILDRPFATLNELLDGMDYTISGIKDKSISNVSHLAIDSVDHAEKLIEKRVISYYRHKSGLSFTTFNEIPKEYQYEKNRMIGDLWNEVWYRVKQFIALDIPVIGLAHSMVSTERNIIDDVEYKYYDMGINPKQSAPTWIHQADAIGFMNYKLTMNGPRQALLDKNPTLHFTPSAQYRSKSPYGLTEYTITQTPTMFMDVFGHLPFYKKQAAA